MSESHATTVSQIPPPEKKNRLFSVWPKSAYVARGTTSKPCVRLRTRLRAETRAIETKTKNTSGGSKGLRLCGIALFLARFCGNFYLLLLFFKTKWFSFFTSLLNLDVLYVVFYCFSVQFCRFQSSPFNTLLHNGGHWSVY